MGADRVTTGPPSSTGIDPFDTQALVLDRRDNQLYISGDARQLKLLHKALTVITALTLTPATSIVLLTQSFNASGLNVANRLLRIRMRLLLNLSANTAVTFTVTLGGNVLFTVVPTVPSGASVPVDFEALVSITALGSAGAAEGHGWTIMTGMPGAVYLDSATAPVTTNLLIAQTLTLTYSAASAPTSISVRYLIAELLS